MTLEEAKKKLIESAQGDSGYESINTWKELAERASFEQDEALFNADKLGDLKTLALNKSESVEG